MNKCEPPLFLPPPSCRCTFAYTRLIYAKILIYSRTLGLGVPEDACPTAILDVVNKQ